MSVGDWLFGDGESPTWWKRCYAYVATLERAVRWPIIVFILLRWLA